MRPDDDPNEDLAGMMEELLEAQRVIDATAKSVVDGVRDLLGKMEEVSPRVREEFAREHAHFYDGTERALGGLGFRTVGDYEPSGQERPPEERTFYRFALSDDGRVAAQWFVVPAEESVECLVLSTWLEDGRSCITGRGLGDTTIPQPPTILQQKVMDGTPTVAAVRAHRGHVSRAGGTPRSLRTVDELLAARDIEQRVIADWRREQGLALFEPMLRAMLGDEYEEQGVPLLESILGHSEWWTGLSTGDDPSWEPPDDLDVRVVFFNSRDEQTGRGLLTTLGMVMYGLPEFQMREIAANHCRAARFLVSIVAHKWVRHVYALPPEATSAERWRTGFEMTLTRDDVVPERVAGMTSGYPEVADEEAGPVACRLVLEPLEGGDPETELLHIGPPEGHAYDADVWLRQACRRLGLNVAEAKPPSAFERDLRAASNRALTRLPEVRTRWRAGFPPRYGLLVKTGLATTRGGKEYVWVRLREWSDDEILGTLESQPNDCPEYEQGQDLRLREADVFDYAVFVEREGLLEPALTDVVAQDFGADLS